MGIEGEYKTVKVPTKLYGYKQRNRNFKIELKDKTLLNKAKPLIV